MAKQCIGLDIGSSSVKAVQLRKKGAGWALQAFGMQPLVAHCHAGLARLCHKTGDPSAAEAHLAMAAALYRGMGMAYWLEQASPSAATRGSL